MTQQEIEKLLHWLWKQRFAEMVYDIGMEGIAKKYLKEQDKQGKESNVCSCKMSGSCRYEVIMHDQQDECRHKVSL